MSTYKKVPIGVSPHWFVYNKRIKEINQALGRYIDFISESNAVVDTVEYYELIAKWANEIKLLAEAEANLLKGDKNGR